jgi:hypothetical protein
MYFTLHTNTRIFLCCIKTQEKHRRMHKELETCSSPGKKLHSFYQSLL